MNINIIQVIVILTIGAIASPTIADSRFTGSYSSWTKNSFNYKFNQKSRHHGDTRRYASQNNNRYSEKWSDHNNQWKKKTYSNNHQPLQAKTHPSRQHDVNKQHNANSYYPPNRWKRFDNQPIKRNGHDVSSKHKKARQYRETKIQYANIRHRPIIYKQRVNKQIVIKQRNNNHRGKKHGHRSYWTPWYNTRYIAPIRRHYHPIGHRVSLLPRARIRLLVGGLPYFYYTGVFYRLVSNNYVVVAAPFNAVIKYLPFGFVTFTIGLSTYYMANDTYYMWDDGKNGYVVVPKPTSASQALEEATQGRLFVYPNKGQNEDQQAKDRYECHRWSVSESSVDPTSEEHEFTNYEKTEYKRGITACLIARDYTVN